MVYNDSINSLYFDRHKTTKYSIYLHIMSMRKWILILILTFFISSVYCGQWKPWGKNNYFFGSRLHTWESARSVCEDDNNAQLAVITSEAENDFLKAMVLHDRDQAWIGLKRGDMECTCRSVTQRQCVACRESWKWVDGTAMNFSQWTDDEPQRKDCGRLVQTGWAENDCGNEYKYICEKHLCDDFLCRHGSCDASDGRTWCVCDAGFTGEHCETDINDCISAPCLNGASCVDFVNSYQCICLRTHTGIHCETEISEDKGSLADVKRSDLVISVCIGAVLAACSVAGLAIMIFLEVRDCSASQERTLSSRPMMNKSASNNQTSLDVGSDQQDSNTVELTHQNIIRSVRLDEENNNDKTKETNIQGMIVTNSTCNFRSSQV